MADRLVQQHAGPAGAEDHGHRASRRWHRFEIDQRLRQRNVDCAVPAFQLEQPIIAPASAKAVNTGFAPPALFGDDRDAETEDPPNTAHDDTVAPHDCDTTPTTHQPDHAHDTGTTHGTPPDPKH